jgi:hypothetical protein
VNGVWRGQHALITGVWNPKVELDHIEGRIVAGEKDSNMKTILNAAVIVAVMVIAGCGPTYQARPLPFKAPAAYSNMVEHDGLQVGGQAYADSKQAQAAFGFDIRAAGMLPVQLVFDHRGDADLAINPGQTFLQDVEGNLWPILTDRFAYERATKYSQTKETFQAGAYKGFLGATAGGLIGAAVGIVSGQDVASAAGKGAAVGGAAGATIGGAAGFAANDARSVIISDLREKSLQNKSIKPGDLSHGIIFFPGEAKSAKQLRLQFQDEQTGRATTLYLNFE